MALVLALVLDYRLGEPPARVHPVVGMGALLSRLAQPLRRVQNPATSHIVAFGAGAVAWAVAAAVVTLMAWALQTAVLHNRALPWWGNACLLAILFKPLFAWNMLYAEVSRIEDALSDNLADGRRQLSMLVSRPTENLSAVEIRETAIETLAENLNDSVVSPLLWFAIGGLPAAALYRLSNTADAMWGYRGTRHGVYWEWTGKWAAWADDVLSWPGARITAALILLCTACWRIRHWLALWRNAHRTPSPNGGWPMSAMAIATNCCLRKPHPTESNSYLYELHPQGLAPDTTHLLHSVHIGHRVVCAMGVLLSLCLLLPYLF